MGTHVDFPAAILDRRGLSQFGNGAVRGILSVDISEWGEPGVVYSRAAQECTAVQIQEEVWTQLKQALNVGDAVNAG